MAIKFVLVEIVLVETVLVGDPLYTVRAPNTNRLQYKPQWQWCAYGTHFSGQKPLSAPLSNQGPAERGAKPHQEKEMGNTFAFATICSTEAISSTIAKNVHLQT